MKTLTTLLACAALLSACGKDPVPMPPLPSSSPSSLPQTTDMSAASNAHRPKGDASKPLDQYEVIDGGAMLLALTQTDRPEGPNLQELATALSARYRNEGDGFKRQDILRAIEPDIESLLLKARNQRYLAMDVRAAYDVETYNFKDKTFELKVFGDRYSNHYFNDHPSATVAFVNKAEFRHMRVDDETVARRIEAMRGKEGMTLRIFFFVAGYNNLQSTLDAQVMATALLDADGKVIAVQKGV